MKPFVMLLANVVVAAAAVGVYHMAVVAPGRSGGAAPADEETAKAMRTLEKDVERLKADSAVRLLPAAAPDRTADLARQLERAIARLKALEEKAGVPSPPAGEEPPPLPVPPSAGGPLAPGWTEPQIVALRAMLDEVDRRKQAERETEQWKRRIEAVKATLSAEQEQQVLDLALDYNHRLKELFGKGSAGFSLEERQAALDRMTQMRSDLEGSFRRFLPDETVTALMKAFPEAPKSAAPIPRPRPAPDGK